jgi:hypothetical protein
MGLMDRVKTQATVLAQRAEDTARDGKAKFDQAQAKRQADAMLRDLGAAVYAERTGRSTDDTDAKIDKLVADLAAHETAHGVDVTAPQNGPAADGTGDDGETDTGTGTGTTQV